MPKTYDIKLGQYVHFELDKKGNVKVTQNNDPKFLDRNPKNKLDYWKKVVDRLK